jgi:hypothetical protein
MAGMKILLIARQAAMACAKQERPGKFCRRLPPAGAGNAISARERRQKRWRCGSSWHMQSITRATAFNPFAYSDRGVRDAEISAHAAFRRRLYDHDVVPEAQAAAAALG